MGDNPKVAADDLRPGIHARLETLNSAYEKAKDRRAQKMKAADDEFRVEVQALEEERTLLSKLMTLQDRQHGGPAQVPGKERTPALPVGDFFVRVVRATGPKTKDEFRELAQQAGYPLDGRGVHAVVVNGMRGGRLLALDGGRYGIPAPQSEELALEIDRRAAG